MIFTEDNILHFRCFTEHHIYCKCSKGIEAYVSIIKNKQQCRINIPPQGAVKQENGREAGTNKCKNLLSKQFLQMLYTVLIGLNGSSCLVHYVKKSYSASLNCMWGPLFPEPFESTFTLLLHLLLCLSINLCFYCSWLDNACLIQNLIIPLDTFYESQLATNVLSNFIKNISHADLRPLNV